MSVGGFAYAGGSVLPPGFTTVSDDGLVRYEDAWDVRQLDQNDVPYTTPPQGRSPRVQRMTRGAGVFPYDIYSHPPMHTGYYVCSRPRDPRAHYIINVERQRHPALFSRFGYGENWNGYGVGIWTGGKYRTSDACCGQSFDPPGMAPPRFYENKPPQDAYVTDSQAYALYDAMKTRGYDV